MRRHPLCLVLACLSMVVASTSWADPTDVSALVVGSVSGRGGIDGSDYFIGGKSVTDLDPVSASVIAYTVSGGDGTNKGSLTASALATHPPDRGEPGLLGMDLRGELTASRNAVPGTNGFFSAGAMDVGVQAIAEYKDEVTFEFSDDASDPMTMEGVMYLHGFAELEAVATGGINPHNVIARVAARVSGENLSTTVLGNIKNAAGEVTPITPDADSLLDLNPVVSFSYNFISGVPSLLSLKLEMSGFAQMGDVNFATLSPGFAHASFEAHYSNTLRWGGITRIVNRRTGEEMTDYHITSAAGFDYTQTFTIPEPTAAGMILMGAVVMVRRREARA